MRYGYLMLLVVLVVAGWSWTGHAQDFRPRATLDQANEAYRRRAYREAIDTYEALLNAGYRQAALYYNLGNSYYRIGDLGRAVLNYERARLRSPVDADIRHNLAVVQQQLPAELEPLPEFFLARWWRSVRNRLSTTGWAVLGLLLWWTAAAGLVLWQRGSTRSRRKWGFVAGVGLLLLGILPLALAASRQAVLHDSGRAVVLAPELSLHSAPDEQSKAIRTLYAGVAIELLDSIGQWRQVRLPNGEEGWLTGEGVERI